MSKIIITADIHCGFQNRLNDCIWSMDVINAYATKNQITNIIIAGDLFHDRTSLGIDIISTVYDHLKKYRDTGVNWVALCGNHDLFLKTSWQINSLHCLGEILTVVEDYQLLKINGRNFHFLPFVHYESKYLEHFLEIEKKASKDDILVTHIGVKGATMNSCFLLKYWKDIDFENCKFNTIFTGHFHCHQQVGNKVWYPGSPIAFKFDEGMVPHGFIVFDTVTNEVEFVKTADASPDGYRPPDFVTIPEENLAESVKFLNGNHVRILWSNQVTANELAKVKEILKAKGALSISWGLVDKEIKDVTLTTKASLGLSSIGTLFETWVKEDNPKLDQNLLLSVHKQIAGEAEERCVVEEDSDDQD